VIQTYSFSEILAAKIVRAPVSSENDGYGIGFKINDEWKSAINNFTLSEENAKKMLNKIEERIKDV
jgi:hypothetical protein